MFVIFLSLFLGFFVYYFNKINFFVLFLLSINLHSFKSDAAISVINFKDVDLSFKDIPSPVYGMAWLESGIISNIRFMMPEKIVTNEEGMRQYEKDENPSPLWNIVKTLFPSTGGGITTSSSHPLNMGRYVTPETIALLMKYSLSLNKKKDSDITPQIMETLTNFYQPVPENFKDRYQEVINILDEIDENDPKWRENVKHTMGIKLSKYTELSNNCLKSAKSLEYFKKRFTKKIASAFENEIKKTIKENKKLRNNFQNKTLNPLLDWIMQNDNIPCSFYPDNAVQHVLSAFLCQHFNNRQDLGRYVTALGSDIPLAEANFVRDDIAEIQAKEHLSPEEQLVLMSDVWDNPTPYSREALINNGLCNSFDREKNMYGEEFPDCIETSLRHFLNILFYDVNTKSFAFNHLKENANPIYFKELEDFYAFQTPDKSNHGSVDIRSRWNRVVAGLNEGEEKYIQYLRGKNELQSDFVNIIKVLNKIFNFYLPINILDKDNLLTIFYNLLSKLHPGINSFIEMNDFKKENDSIYGTMKIDINNLYSFAISMKKGHGDLDIERVDAGKTINLNEKITDPILKILDENLKHDVENSFYKLMGLKLHDNEYFIKFLESFDRLSEDKKEEISQNASILIDNILSTLTWDDFHVQDLLKNSNIIERLASVSFLEKILEKNVRYLIWTGDQESFDNKISLFKNCHTINLKDNKDIQTLDLSGKNFPFLKKLDIRDTNINTIKLYDMDFFEEIQFFQCFHVNYLKNVFLNNLPSLKNLNFIGQNLDSLELKNMNSITDLNLGDIHVKNVHLSGRDLPALQKFTLGNARGKCMVESLQLEDMDLLESVDIQSLKNLKNMFLNNLPVLKELNCSNTHFGNFEFKGMSALESLGLHGGYMKKLSLEGENLPVLKNLTLHDFEVEDLILQNIPYLEVLNLFTVKKLKSVFFENLSLIKEINIPSSSLINIHLKGFDILERLIFDKLTKDTFEIDGADFPALQNLNLPTCNIETLMLKNMLKLSRFLLNNKERISNLSLINLPMIQTFQLSNLIQTLNLERMNSLKKITFNKVVNEDNFVLDLKDAPVLKALDFLSSNFENVTVVNSNVLRQVSLTSTNIRNFVLNNISKMTFKNVRLSKSIIENM